MIISTRGRYALRVMVALAQSPAGEYIALKDITEAEDISKEYLNNILKVLVQHGLLDSLRGKGGGYKLHEPAEAYSVGQILRLVEGSLAPVPCAGGESCPRADRCPSLPMWRRLDKMINDFFDGITLADLAETPPEEEPGQKPAE